MATMRRMSQRGLWSKGFVVIVATFFATHSHAQITIIPQEQLTEATNPTLATGAKMVFDCGEAISFGIIEESGGAWSSRIKWSEQTDKKLTISRITTSCNCLEAKWNKREAVAASRGEIEIVYHPKGHAGKVEQKIFIYTDLSDTHPTAIVRVVGMVTASADRSGDYPHTCGTLRLKCKEVMVDGESQVRIAVMNGGSTPLTITQDNNLSLGGVKAHTEPTTLQPLEEGDLVIETGERNAQSHKVLYLKGIDTAPRNRKIEIKEAEN